MSSIKKNPKFAQVDSDEDDDITNFTYQNSKSLGASQRMRSPAKQPWKNSSKLGSLTASQLGTSTKKVQKPKYTLPSQSCAREKQELRHQISHLEDSIRSKNSRIKNLKSQINQEKVERDQVQEELRTQQEWRDIAEQLRYDNQNLKQGELNLYSELQEQQILTKEALNKLYEHREEALEEKEKLRQMYEQYAEDRVQEERMRNMEQINNLLDLNDKLKAQVINIESQFNSLKNQEKLQTQVDNYKNAVLRKKQLRDSELEKEDLIRKQLLERELHNKEVNRLRSEIQYKEREIQEREYDTAQRDRVLRSQAELEASRRIVDFELENNALRKELEFTSSKLRNTDFKYKSTKNDLNSSFGNLQSQLSNLKYDIEDIKYENKKILQTLSPQRKR